MRIRRSRGVRALAVAATAGLLLGGVAITSANAAPTAGLDATSGLDTPSELEDATSGLEDATSGLEDATSGLEDATSGLEDATSGADTPSTPTTPEPCSEPPNVDVDQSDPTATTISVSFSCQAEAELHRIITASVGGTEVLKIDTRTATSGDATHATEITLPKAVVCITDGTTGEENCLPS